MAARRSAPAFFASASPSRERSLRYPATVLRASPRSSCQALQITVEHPPPGRDGGFGGCRGFRRRHGSARGLGGSGVIPRAVQISRISASTSVTAESFAFWKISFTSSGRASIPRSWSQ